MMGEYKRLNFKNHPSISTELVKFLAINTSFEAIEKLTAKVAALETETSDAKKQLSAAVKAVSSAGNRADEAKKLSG
jgi:capsule polysaccharide export protein KpsE/RkpR